MTLTHDEIRELLGAYALDAVDGVEAEAVTDHLRDCPRCRAEVASYREAASALAHSGADAPPGLWDRIALQLDEAPPPLALAPVVPMRGRSKAMSRPGTLSRRAMPALVAVAAVLVALLGVRVVQQDRRISELVGVVQQGGLARAAAAASLHPDARRVELLSGDGRLGVVAVLARDGRGYLVEHNLPALGPDRTYQLWGVMGDRTVSLGVLGNAWDLVAFHASGSVAALAITEEAAGGVVATEQQPLVSGLVGRRA